MESATERQCVVANANGRRENNREREGERERYRVSEKERVGVLGLCVVVQGFVRPLRGCG